MSTTPRDARETPYLLQVGTRIRVTLTNGTAYDMTVSQRHAPGDMGRSHASGPHIVAHIRPGGWSTALDSSEVAHVAVIEDEPTPATCAAPGTNHSPDLIEVHSGRPEPVTVCGYHLMRDPALTTLRPA